MDFTGTQPTSPVWQTKIPRGRIALFEELSYWANAENELSDDPLFAEGAGLVQKSMGTDAQVSFALSQYGNRGMIELKSITDLDAQSAQEIDELIFSKPYSNLYELLDRLEGFKSEGLSISDLANAVASEAAQSVRKSISWTLTYCTELDREVQEGRAGRRGRTQVNENDKYMYRMVQKQVPAGFDAPAKPADSGDVLGALQALLKGGNASGVDVAEHEALQAAYEDALKTIKAQQTVIEEVTKNEQS